MRVARWVTAAGSAWLAAGGGAAPECAAGGEGDEACAWSAGPSAGLDNGLRLDWSAFLAAEPGFALASFHPLRAAPELLERARESAQRSLAAHREALGLEAQPPEDSLGPVVFIGGGPVGLMGAVTARLAGRRAVVLEKRSDYSRSIWFDYYNEPWSRALGWLDALGFHALGREGEDWEGHEDLVAGDKIRTLRCHSLERFLSLVAVALGAEVRFGERATIAAADALRPALVVDASGANSAFPEECGLPPRAHPRALVWRDRVEVPYAADDLAQMTWLASMSDCSSSFPQGDPFFPSTQPGLEQLTMLFQRQFGSECELQALFRAAVRTPEQAAPAVARVKANFKGTVEWERTFPIAIKVLERPFVEGCASAPVLFLGDSALISYYRMGVGLHKAFVEMDIFRSIVAALEAPATAREPLIDALAASQRHWAQYELSVMALEAFCGLFVGFSLEADSMDEAGTVHERDAYGDYNDVDDARIRACFESAARAHAA